jgi:hypothetical protein
MTAFIIAHPYMDLVSDTRNTSSTLRRSQGRAILSLISLPQPAVLSHKGIRNLKATEVNMRRGSGTSEKVS